MLLKPRNSLNERLLLGIDLCLRSDSASDSKAMMHVTIQVDLVRPPILLQNILCLNPILPRLYLVLICTSDAQGALNSLQHLGRDARWVGDEASVDVLKTGILGEEIEDPGCAGGEAHGANFCAFSLDLQVLDCTVDELQLFLLGLRSYDGV